MKILFSPSETKLKDSIPNSNFDNNSFIFPELFEYRLEVLNLYNDYISNSSNDDLMKLFGTKKQEVIDYYKSDIFSKNIQKVILRYDGVAYDYLKYNTLQSHHQKYIDENVLIFSNLFGVVRAGDIGIPDYKLKQGQKIKDKLDEFAIEKFYKKHFRKALDEFLVDEDILDLRAGFYEKFYTISKPYITMKFIKDGKVVSHWAKAYRGVVLKLMSINNIQTIDELLDMEIDNLHIQEIQKTKLKTNIIYNICN
jgi:cytoplasmic iron level regulating protein YaaA (DUF328/UPF0246 family)